MRSVLTVVRREYLVRVRTRWFVFSTLGGPVLAFAAFAGPAYLAQRGEDTLRTMAVVDRTGVLYGRVASRLREGGFIVEGDEGTVWTGEELESMARAGQIGGYLILDSETLSKGWAGFRGAAHPGSLRALTIRGAVVESVLDVRLAADGTDEDIMVLLGGGELDVQLVGQEASGGDSARGLVAGFVGALILYVMIIFYAVAVMRAVIAEKTDRIVEIIISAIRPWELMLGKIVGVAAVGLTQLGAWLVMGGIVVALGLPVLLATRHGALVPEDILIALPEWRLAVLFLAFFVLGYLLYAALYAAVGAMCSSEHEAQQAQLPVVLLLVVPLLVLSSSLENPTAGVSVGLALVPFFSPILMFANAAAGYAPPWQVALSLLLMALTIGLVAWVAGRIYRVGILMQGKRPSLPEVVRWVREA